jgi:hypothetical protein
MDELGTGFLRVAVSRRNTNQRNGGRLRAIDTAVETCDAESEVTLACNRIGPQGPPGPQGPQGIQGGARPDRWGRRASGASTGHPDPEGRTSPPDLWHCWP